MANEWILDVLADLSAFAEQNGLPALERQLALAAEAAEMDLNGIRGVSLTESGQGIGHVGIHHRVAAESTNA